MEEWQVLINGVDKLGVTLCGVCSPRFILSGPEGFVNLKVFLFIYFTDKSRHFYSRIKRSFLSFNCFTLV